MMNRGLKTGLAFLIALLILGHALLLFLFFCPIQIVAGSAGLSIQNFISTQQLPTSAKQIFNFTPLPASLLLPPKKGVWEKFNQTLLQARYKKMNPEQRRELILNTLPFGEEVFGLNAGAFYYFQKPLNQLSNQELINLAAFYKIFEDNN